MDAVRVEQVGMGACGDLPVGEVDVGSGPGHCCKRLIDLRGPWLRPQVDVDEVDLARGSDLIEEFVKQLARERAVGAEAEQHHRA